MAQKISFNIGGHLMGAHDSALILDDEDPRKALVEAAIQTVSTDIEITAGGVTLHLAAWDDPDHWSEEWEEALGEGCDPEEFIKGLLEEGL